MKTTITDELTIGAEFEYRQARLLAECLDVSVNTDAWYGILRRLEHTKAPLYIVTAYDVYVADMPFLSERYVLTAEGLELDEADPTDWVIFSDLDEARRAVAETIVGPDQPRQVALVTITH